MTNKPTYKELEQKVSQLENDLQSLRLPGFPKDKDMFRLAFENANTGMCLVDLKGNLFKVNAEMSEIFGYSVPELENMNVNDIALPDFKDVSPQFIHNALEGVSPHSIFEKKYLHKNGGEIACTITSSAVYDENNNITFFISQVQDISARKKSEQALRDSEARLRSYFELPLIGIAITSPEKGWIEANEGAKIMLGYSMEELAGQSWANLTHPDDLAADVEQFEQVLADKQDTYFLEKRFIRKNGEIIWTKLSVGCVRKPDHSVDYMIALLQDITKRKIAEEALRESESRYHDLYDNAPDMYLSVDPQTRRIVECNQTTVRKTGFAKDEIIGKPVMEMYHPDSADKARQAFQNFITKGEVRNTELQVCCKDESLLDVSLNVSAVRDKNGNVILSRSSWNDISDRRKAEKILEESQQRFRTIMENVDLISVNLDTNGNITFANDYFLKLTGWQREEVFGQNWFKLFIPPDVELRQVLNKDLEKGKLPPNHQNEIMTRKGERRLINWSNYGLRDARGENAGIAGIGVDVTEQKLATEALKQSEAKLKEAVATKDKFFSIIAHDLRSPFNSILGLSDVLVEQIREQNNKDFEQIALKVNTSANNAFQLLTNLLEWSRSQTNRLEFVPEHLEFGTTIEEEIKLAKDSAGQKSVTILKDIPKDIFVYADKSMIRLVLRNLISNAIKYSHAGGKIKVSVEQKQDKLIVYVRDDGIGISKENVNKLFKVGEIFSTRGTKNEQGTGLGLILCKEFIEKQGGKIWVESEPGIGSKFIFSIPFSE